MRNVTDRTRNPFGMTPPCEQFVPGYGDANANFHVIGDHPGIHGGLRDRIPFTGEAWSPEFLDALTAAGLLETAGETADGTPLTVDRTFLSYLHMCAPPDGASEPAPESYDDLERFFDAELRAIAAHVLLPVGARATRHVLEQYTAQAHKLAVDMDTLHATEVRGSGWLVVPIKDPAEWNRSDAEELVDGLQELQRTDYRRETDLGRFIAGSDPYLVR